MEETVKYPLNYIGSKHKLISTFKDIFPKKISMFYDVFGGGGNVSINILSEHTYCNDINKYVISVLKGIQDTQDINDLLHRIDNIIDTYKLSKTNREGFEKLRLDYNNGQNDWITLFVLVSYSFNYQMRFNNSHQYNSSFGKDRSCLTNNMRKNLIKFNNAIQNKDIIFDNKDFRNVGLSDADENDLVYLDPPYLLSCGVYQDGRRGFTGWSEKDERDLYGLCDVLDKQGVRFALSNVIESKGNTNELLKSWSKGYNIHYLNKDYGNSSYQRKSRSGDVEVLITNY